MPFSKMVPALTSPSRVPQLVPDPVVGPVLDVLVGGDLEVQPADLLRAHRVQREPALVPGVDQLVGGGLRLGEDPEPAELIDVVVLGHVLGDRRRGRRRGSRRIPRSRRTSSSSSAPVVRVNVIRGASASMSWSFTSQTSNRTPHAAVEQRRDQVLDDLLLAVDRDVPAGQRGHVDVVVLVRCGAGRCRRARALRGPGARRRRGRAAGSRCSARAARRGRASRRTPGCAPRARRSRCPRAAAASRA